MEQTQPKKTWQALFERYFERVYEVDIEPIIKGTEVIEQNFKNNERKIRIEFLWELGPLHDMTKTKFVGEIEDTSFCRFITLLIANFITTQIFQHDGGDFFRAKQNPNETENQWKKMCTLEAFEFKVFTTSEI